MNTGVGADGRPVGRVIPEAAYEEIVETSGVAFSIVDESWTILYAGESVSEVLGWRPEELVGRNLVELLPPEQLERAATAMADLGRPDGREGLPVVFRGARSDNTFGHVEIGAVALKSWPGHVALRLRDWRAHDSLDRFIETIVDNRDVDDMMSPLAQAAGEAVRACASAILWGFDGHSFRAAVAHCVEADTLRLARGPWCSAATHGHVMSIPAEDVIGAADVPEGANSCWVMPVVDATYGAAAIVVFHPHAGPPLFGHRLVLERYTKYVRLAIAHTDEQARLRQLADTDGLTGALNRVSFEARLQELLDRGQTGFTVGFCDLDDFKGINDRFGHAVGDEVLIAIVQRLRSSLRRADVLGRFGGDEFTLLLHDSDDAWTARVAGERLQRALQEPIETAAGPLEPHMSIGLAVAEPDDTTEQLMLRADRAVYQAKRAGGRRFVIV